MFRRLFKTSKRPARPRSRTRLPRFEMLEQRNLLATFTDTIGLYDPNAVFHVKNDFSAVMAPDDSIVWGWGTNAGFLPVAGDWDGDGEDTIGLYDPNAVFQVKNDFTPGGAPDDWLVWGWGSTAGYYPIAGDWDGDGLDTIGLYSPTGAISLKNDFTPGGPDIYFEWGEGTSQDWLPVAGDWNGDGIDTVGLYAPNGVFLFKNGFTSESPLTWLTWGWGADDGYLPIAGDWDADGVDTIGLYDANAVFSVKNDFSSGEGPEDWLVWGWGTSQNWLPIAGDWNGADQPPYEAFFDFGTASSPLSPGFARVSNSTQYTAAQGYGWLSGVVSGSDRGGSGLLERDINYTRDATFVVDVPNGEYRIDILMGDLAIYAHDLMGVLLEGAQVASVSTAARQLVNNHFDVEVTDGQLTLRLMDLGGGNANVVVEGLRILAAGTDDPVSNAWWPAREGIPNALFSARTQSGVYDYYLVETAYQRTGNNIRVLLPDDYDPQQAYPVIYVLPVEKGDGRQFGDGMASIYNHGLHRTTDAIFVQPTFSDTPWFADNIFDSTVWQETYFRDVIVPFIEEQYPVIDGPDGRLLLGYSKSGYGAVSMLLRNQDYFGRAVAWDAPLAMSDPASGWDFLYVLGSASNFHANYQITNLLQAEGLGLIGQPPRIFLQGYSYDFTRADHAAIHAQMTNLGIPHTYDLGVYRSHLWASGWMPGAVAALMADV